MFFTFLYVYGTVYIYATIWALFPHFLIMTDHRNVSTHKNTCMPLY